MNRKLVGLAVVASSMTMAASGSAQTLVVAGWDFSQYAGSSSTAIDLSFANVFTADAQYSDLDVAANPTPGLGSAGFAYNSGLGAGLFGQMVHDGTLGSSDTSASPGSYAALTGSLVSNADAPALAIDMSTQGGAEALTAEGQTFGNDLSMQATSTVDVVFTADRTVGNVPTGSDWSLSFGGRTTGASSLVVSVESSTDGASYGSEGTVTLTPTDSQFVVDLTPSGGNEMFVRLGLVGGALVDNVAIQIDSGVAVPLPPWMLAPIAGGIVAAGRRRLPMAA